MYAVKKEYESEGEKEQRKKIVQLGPRKFEGIGPMTKDGIPIVLRSVSSYFRTGQLCSQDFSRLQDSSNASSSPSVLSCYT